jgi:transposase
MFSSLLDPRETREEEAMARVTHAAPHLPIAEVKNRMRTDPRADRRQRWLIIYNALVEPRSAAEIARHCGVSKATVHAVISRYNRLGVAAIETPGKGGRRRQYLTLEEEKQFLAPFFAQAERGEIATVGQIWCAFEQHVGHAVDDSTIYRLLHRHGWRKLMPRPRHPKADQQTQEQFKKNFPAQVEAAIVTREVGDERPLLIMTQDEGCFGRMSRAKRCWAPPGIRPHVPTQVVREYVYAYAAVAPALGQMVSLILPEASTEMMNLFLEQVSQTFSKHFIVMQVDGAGWHRANDLIIPENIRLIPQPAYSPELNPVEHIWDELREKYFHNRIFSSLELLIDVLCQGLTALADDADRLRSLTGFPHLQVAI